MSATSTEVLSNRSRRVIVHIDGDAFFASCEVSKNPALRGKPVVVGGLRGIAVAMTYEAKARGIYRGMPAFEIRRVCPEAIILPGDYALYSQYAERMYNIVRKHTPFVEEYSVDECFADITTSAKTDEAYEHIARSIQQNLNRDLGITFSVGVAATKVLAKVGSKHNKPSGLVYIRPGTEDLYLRNLGVHKLWGVGQATAHLLRSRGVYTALDFKNRDEWWVRSVCTKPHRALWDELNGRSVFEVESDGFGDPHSVASTRTFRPPSKDKKFVFAQLSKNIEEACSRARVQNLSTNLALCFLKSQEFQYKRFEVPLQLRTNIQSEIIKVVRPAFESAFVNGILYRATGVTLARIERGVSRQLDLFGNDHGHDAYEKAYQAYDEVRSKYGSRSIFLASTMPALKNIRSPKHFSIPHLGDVY